MSRYAVIHLAAPVEAIGSAPRSFFRPGQDGVSGIYDDANRPGVMIKSEKLAPDQIGFIPWANVRGAIILKDEPKK